MRFAPEKRVLGEITGELRQNCKRLARLLLPHMHDREQNSGERTEITSSASHPFEFLGREALLTFDASKRTNHRTKKGMLPSRYSHAPPVSSPST